MASGGKAALLLSTASTIRIITSSDDEAGGTPANPIQLDTPPPPVLPKIDFKRALLEEGKGPASLSTKSPAKAVNAGAEQKASASKIKATIPATNVSANDVSVIGGQNQELTGNTSGGKAEGKRKLPVKNVSGDGDQGEHDQQRECKRELEQDQELMGNTSGSKVEGKRKFSIKRVSVSGKSRHERERKEADELKRKRNLTSNRSAIKDVS